jgi:3-dehydroquinate synthase
VLDPANVRDLKSSGVLFYLKASAPELSRRLDGQNDRPLLKTNGKAPKGSDLSKRIESLLTERESVYEAVADHIVSSDGRTVRDVADEVKRAMKAKARPGLRSVKRVRVAIEPPYQVLIGRGILQDVADLVKIPAGAENVGIVSHMKVKRLWGESLEKSLRAGGLSVSWHTFPEGEANKTIETAARLCERLAASGFHRGDLLFGLGGGVVGDVTGYVASTFARGISVVQVPTTLLAMVDAAIGGKTGVNLPQGKNLVGTFHQPLGVVSDLSVLETLPVRELRGGLAEVVKYGFIDDPSLLRSVARDGEEVIGCGPALGPLVARCSKIKADVVAADERERGLRAILNYGHTLGHAIESLSIERGGRAKLHHGEAIAVGMVYAARVSSLLGLPDLVDEHRHVLEAVGLPTRVGGLGWSQVSKRMQTDKKFSGGARLVLLKGRGSPVVRKVDPKVLREAFAEVSA